MKQNRGCIVKSDSHTSSQGHVHAQDMSGLAMDAKLVIIGRIEARTKGKEVARESARGEYSCFARSEEQFIGVQKQTSHR
jgi:hypothetical protein